MILDTFLPLNHNLYFRNGLQHASIIILYPIWVSCYTVQIVYLFTMSVFKLPRVHTPSYASKFERFCGKKLVHFDKMRLCTNFHTVPYPFAFGRKPALFFCIQLCTTAVFSLYREIKSRLLYVDVCIQHYVEEN